MADAFITRSSKSAYQSAVEGGYTGTETQFNTDLGNIDDMQLKSNMVTSLSSSSDNTHYPTAKAITSYAATVKNYNVNVTTTWSGSTAPFTQAITVSGITASDTPIYDIVLGSDYSQKETLITEFDKIYRLVTAANKITLYADEKTTTPITIQLKVVK